MRRIPKQKLLTTNSGEIVLSGEQIKYARIEYGQLQEVMMPQEIRARGMLVLPNNRKASAGSFIDGVVKEIYVTKGQSVRKGSPLCRISDPGIIEVQQEFMTAYYQLQNAEAQYERTKKLFDKEIISGKNFQEVETAYLKAKNNYQTYKTSLEILSIDIENLKEGNISSGIEIRSPIEGVVSDISTQIGSHIIKEEELFEIVDRSVLFVELLVLEKDVSGLKVGQKVIFSLSNRDTRQYEAVIHSISSSIDAKARVLPVIAEFNNNEEQLYPGMFVAARIITDEHQAKVLPVDAVIAEGEDIKYIFYTLDPESSDQISYHKLDVKTGAFNNKYY